PLSVAGRAVPIVGSRLPGGAPAVGCRTDMDRQVPSGRVLRGAFNRNRFKCHRLFRVPTGGRAGTWRARPRESLRGRGPAAPSIGEELAREGPDASGDEASHKKFDRAGAGDG